MASTSAQLKLEPDESPGRRARSASLPQFVWQSCGRAPQTALQRASVTVKAVQGERYTRWLWVVMAVLLVWCVVTTLLLLRLAWHVYRVEQSVELLEETTAGGAEDENVKKMLDKGRAVGNALRRGVARLPLVSALYIVLAPHIGWISTLVAPHIAPLRFLGARLLWALRQLRPLFRMLPPLLQRVKPLLVAVELRAKVRMLLTEWSGKRQAAAAVASKAGRGG